MCVWGGRGGVVADGIGGVIREVENGQADGGQKQDTRIRKAGERW